MRTQSTPASISADAAAHAPAAARGAFIAFEGGDGAGKSTQLRLLAESLRERGVPVLHTREPGGSAMGEQIRSLVLDPEHAPVDPRTEALLFAASRSAHVERTLRPALADGVAVLTDRYLDSSVAYQGAARGLGPAAVRELNLWAVDGLLPDLTVLLDVPEDTGRRRRADRAADRMEQEPARSRKARRTSSWKGAGSAPERYLVLPADSPVDRLAERIRERVLELLRTRREASGDPVPGDPTASGPAAGGIAPATTGGRR